MHKPIVIGALLAVTACAAPAPELTTAPPSRMDNVTGLERVLGHNAAELTALFGEPDQDFREEGARKLQFANAQCVLDTYLYAERRGAEPVVTYVDARNPAGDDVDRAGCVEALARR